MTALLRFNGDSDPDYFVADLLCAYQAVIFVVFFPALAAPEACGELADNNRLAA